MTYRWETAVETKPQTYRWEEPITTPTIQIAQPTPSTPIRPVFPTAKPTTPSAPIVPPFPTVPLVATHTTAPHPLYGTLYPEAFQGIPTIELVPFTDAAKVFGESIKYLPKQVAVSVLQATQGQGGASVVNKDWADVFITEANEDLDKFVQDIQTLYPFSRTLQELSQLSRNLAYSITSGGAGLAVGAPIAFIPLPGARVAAWVAGTAVSGAIAYQMTTYQITQQYLEAMNDKKITDTGSGLTLEEENQLKIDFHDKAIKYGLWEAIPEALSNLAFAKILTKPLTSIVGKSIANTIVGKLAGIYGEELLTETITQKGQSAIEVEAGLREGNISWAEAFREIAPQTFLLTTIMAGAGQTIVSSTQAVKKITNSLKNEIGDTHPLYTLIKENIESEWETVTMGAPATSSVEWATVTEPTEGVEFQPITSNIGKGYEILQNDKVVGTITYGTTEALGVEGMIIGRIDIKESARRQGLATQAIDKVLSEAEQAGILLYSGMLEPDGVKLFNALEKRGVISLTPSGQRMLGEIITRPVPEYAPTTAMAEGGISESEWATMTIADKVDLVKSLGLEGKVASKEWAYLTKPEKDAISGAIPKTGMLEIPSGIVPPTESIVIPKELPTTPPSLTPEGETLGRTPNESSGFMADLQDAQTVVDIAFHNDMIRKWAEKLPPIRGLMSVLNPEVVADTPAKKAIIIRATLRDEGYQKTQGVMAYLNELGRQEKIFGNLDSKGFIKSGALKGQTVGDIAQQRSKWESKLTDEQKFWLDRAEVIENAVTEFLKRNDIDIKLLKLEEGGQFATRRVWAKSLNDGTVIDVAYVGTGIGRPGSRLPIEKHRIFKTEAEAIEAGYKYIPYEEALYLKVAGAYNRVADKEMADWLLTQVPWRTTGAPEELVLAAESARLKLRHSQMLLAALNRAVRGERIPTVVIKAISTSYPDQAQKLKDLVPKLQAAEPVADEVQELTRIAKGLIDTNKMLQARAISARARAREIAITPRVGEAVIPAPAFAGKILTGSDAQETARILRKTFDASFSKSLGQVNKLNAVARYFMLAGDFSPFTIQLLFLFGENPKIYSKAFGGAIRAMLDPDYQARFLSRHKATIDKHPNLLISRGGTTEFTEAMARGGWLSGKTSFRPEAESYWKSLGLFMPRAMAKIGGITLTPFQRVFEQALDSAGIYMAEAYEHLCITPEVTADVDQFINEFRGLTSTSRIGISGIQRQLETGILLAPRYNRAIAGLLYDLNRRNIRGHLARKSLIKGIAALVAMGVLISIARGEDKDEILEHFNPNSSMFFTWDVAGQKIGPGSKIRSLIKLIAQSASNPDELLEFSMDNPALRFVRGNLAPVVSSAIDLFTGKSYIGDPTRDGMLHFTEEILAGNLLPIWLQSVLLEGGDMKGRTARGIVEFFGGRAYPEPLWDEVGKLRDKYAQLDYNTKYVDLYRAQIDKLKENHPDLVDLEVKAELESANRGDEVSQGIKTIIEAATERHNTKLEEAAVLLLNGSISKYDYDNERGYYRPYYSGEMNAIYDLRDILQPETIKDINKWLSENQKPEDKALNAYQEYRASLIEKSELPRDWDTIEAQCEAYLAKLPKAIREYVEANLNRWINDLPENAKQVELMRLQAIEDETWWDDYRGITSEYRWEGGGTTGGTKYRWE